MRMGFTEKRCPRCGGNVYLDRDYYGWYEECLQCGYIRELASIVEAGEKVGGGNPSRAEGSARIEDAKK